MTSPSASVDRVPEAADRDYGVRVDPATGDTLSFGPAGGFDVSLDRRRVFVRPVEGDPTVLDEGGTWAGITTKPISRGATTILFEGHELGHVHANRGTLDLRLPTDRRAQVLEAGRAKAWFSGWVTKQLASRADADDGIALLRESYDTLRAPLASPAKSQP